MARWTAIGDIALFTELHRLTVHTLGRSLIDEPVLWDEAGDFWAARERLWRWISATAGQGRPLASRGEENHDPGVDTAITTVQTVVDEVIAKRLRTRRPPADLLSEILAAAPAAGNPLSRTEIRDQIIALLFAGHETSAAALFWTLHLLATNPHERDRVERELDTVLAGGRPELRDLHALRYTLMAIKEAMRLYPPAGRQFRVPARDAVLGGHDIKAGTPVTVCHYLLHRSSSARARPGAFIPEEFAGAAAAHKPGSYIPFGLGERICPGRHYALMELHLITALITARYRITFREPAAAQLGVTLRPAGEPRAWVCPRFPHEHAM